MSFLGTTLLLVIVNLVITAGAYASAQGVAPPKKPHFIEQIMPIVFIFILFYFLLIRPAQKRQKKHQDLVQQLKKGDKVLTSSGILGVIYGLTDTFVTLEVAQNVRIRVLRSQISSFAESETKGVDKAKIKS